MEYFAYLIIVLLSAFVLGILYWLRVWRVVTRVLGISCCVAAIYLHIRCQMTGVYHEFAEWVAKPVTDTIVEINERTSLITIVLNTLRKCLELMHRLDEVLAWAQDSLFAIIIVVAMIGVVLYYLPRITSFIKHLLGR